MKLHEFFYFNKSDRQVLLFLLLLIAIIVGGFYLIGGRNRQTAFTAEDSVLFQKTPISSEERYAAQQQGYYDAAGSSSSVSAAYSGGYYSGEHRVERFPFDPNTADSTQLLRLGLRSWQVKNIYKYRANGGVYRTPSDFARLYGLTQKEYHELEPYIRISKDYRPASELFDKSSIDAQPISSDNRSQYRDTLKYPLKLKENEFVMLNSLDTNQYKKVPGIGSHYARRIAEYGRRLGGYVSTEQLREINGFPEESIRFFKLNTTHIKKINLNQLTLNQLKSHPYLDFYQARAIIDYRRLREPLKSLDDLKLLPEFPSDARQRLAPYVEF
ncbi:MAG: helix-hairpin-helix domain-containing protein [Prevotella sp.]|nr:helix-hairpin-helix domain-containing protein [Prevotella sp.]